MHWQLATASVNVNTSDTLYVNACMREGAGTSTLKKVTCKDCKQCIAQPVTPTQTANLFAEHIDRIQEKSDFYAALVCNACSEEHDVLAAILLPPHERIASLMSFLTHCAYDHSLGAEAMLSAVYAPLSVYQLNYALGKTPGTVHEEKWRASHGLTHAQKA